MQDFLALVTDLPMHSNGNQKGMSMSTAIKFMMARKFDIFRAVSLYEAHEVIILHAFFFLSLILNEQKSIVLPKFVLNLKSYL